MTQRMTLCGKQKLCGEGKAWINYTCQTYVIPNSTTRRHLIYTFGEHLIGTNYDHLLLNTKKGFCCIVFEPVFINNFHTLGTLTIKDKNEAHNLHVAIPHGCHGTRLQQLWGLCQEVGCLPS